MNEVMIPETFLDGDEKKTRIRIYNFFGQDTGRTFEVTGYVKYAMVVGESYIVISAGNILPGFLNGEQVSIYVFDVIGGGMASRILSGEGYSEFGGDASFYATNDGFIIAKANDKVYILNSSCDKIAMFVEDPSLVAIVGGIGNMAIVQYKVVKSAEYSILSAAASAGSFTFSTDPGFIAGTKIAVRGTVDVDGDYTIQSNAGGGVYIVAETVADDQGAGGTAKGFAYQYVLKDLDWESVAETAERNGRLVFSSTANPMVLFYADADSGEFGAMDTALRVMAYGPAPYSTTADHQIGATKLYVERQIERIVSPSGTLSIGGSSVSYSGFSSTLKCFTLSSPLSFTIGSGSVVYPTMRLKISNIRDGHKSFMIFNNDAHPTQPSIEHYSFDYNPSSGVGGIGWITSISYNPTVSSVYGFDTDQSGGMWYASPSGITRSKTRFSPARYENPATGGISTTYPDNIAFGPNFLIVGDICARRYLSQYRLPNRLLAMQDSVRILNNSNMQTFEVDVGGPGVVAMSEQRIVLWSPSHSMRKVMVFGSQMGYMYDIDLGEDVSITAMSIGGGSVCVASSVHGAPPGQYLKIFFIDLVSKTVSSVIDLGGFSNSRRLRVTPSGNVFLADGSRVAFVSPGGVEFNLPIITKKTNSPLVCPSPIVGFGGELMVSTVYSEGSPSTIKWLNQVLFPDGTIKGEYSLDVCSVSAASPISSAGACIDLYGNLFLATLILGGNPGVVNPGSPVTILNGDGIISGLNFSTTQIFNNVSIDVDIDNRPYVRLRGIGGGSNINAKLFIGEALAASSDYGVIITRATSELAPILSWEESQRPYFRGRLDERHHFKRG